MSLVSDSEMDSSRSRWRPLMPAHGQGSVRIMAQVPQFGFADHAILSLNDVDGSWIEDSVLDKVEGLGWG